MRRKGISLLEIVIASSIMIAAMVPLWGLLGSSHRQVTLSADEIRASQIAVEILEQVENLGFAPENGEFSFTPVSGGKNSLGNTRKFDLNFGEFPEYLDLKAVLDVSRFPLTGPETGKIIKLNLKYKTKEKVGIEEKSFSLATFIGR